MSLLSWFNLSYFLHKLIFLLFCLHIILNSHFLNRLFFDLVLLLSIWHILQPFFKVLHPIKLFIIHFSSLNLFNYFSQNLIIIFVRTFGVIIYQKFEVQRLIGVDDSCVISRQMPVLDGSLQLMKGNDYWHRLRWKVKGFWAIAKSWVFATMKRFAFRSIWSFIGSRPWSIHFYLILQRSGVLGFWGPKTPKPRGNANIVSGQLVLKVVDLGQGNTVL